MYTVMLSDSFASLSAPFLKYRILIHDKEWIVNVPYEVASNINWKTLVRIAINHSMDNLSPWKRKDHFVGVKIVGVLDCQNNIMIPAEQQIPITTRNLLNIASPSYSAILLGPIHMLSEKLLQKVLVEYLHTAQDLSRLCRVNKEFRRLFMSDFIWKDVSYPYTDWLGYGCDGNEEEIWRQVRIQQGLTHFGSYRLRWHSHNTSRMLLFYGKIGTLLRAKDNEDGFMERISQLVLNTKSPDPINKISVVGGRGAIKLIEQLHFLIPPSATSYHLDRNCPSLLPNGKLINVEPSPLRSKSRKHFKDPGTRVETNCWGDMVLRRIGDERLTFFQVEYGIPSARFNYVSWVSLCQALLGHVIVLDATDECSLEIVRQRLHKILNNLLKSAMCTLPVLILIGLSKSDTAKSKTVHEIGNSLARVYLPNCPWYVQPYHAQASLGGLREGYLAGLNWLLRNILLQKSAT